MAAELGLDRGYRVTWEGEDVVAHGLDCPRCRPQQGQDVDGMGCWLGFVDFPELDELAQLGDDSWEERVGVSFMGFDVGSDDDRGRRSSGLGLRRKCSFD